MIDDLYATAKAWIQDQGLPEPTGLKLIPGLGINLDYITPGVKLPELPWRDSSDGLFRVYQEDLDGVRVSVFAKKPVAA